MTQQLLWFEYCDQCRASGEIPYQLTQFKTHYREYVAKTKATMHIQSKPIELMEVDWAGQTAHLVDADTGELLDAYIFVAALPYSGYAYTEAFMSLPYIVLGLSMLIIFSSPFGKALKAAGLPVVFSGNGIILAQLVVNLPFAVKLTSAAFRSVDQKLERVAGLLGATPGKCFFTILLPLSKNALISALILVWSRALGEFGATLMLVGITRMERGAIQELRKLGLSYRAIARKVNCAHGEEYDRPIF